MRYLAYRLLENHVVGRDGTFVAMSELRKNFLSIISAYDAGDEGLSFEENTAAECAVGSPGLDGEMDGFLNDHYPRVVAMLRRRTGSQEDAEDLAQESAMRLLRYRDLQSPSSWRALFYRIAQNAFNDWGRHRKSALSRSTVSFDDVQIADPIASPGRMQDAHEQASLVISAIESLPPKCQQVFLLSRKAGMSNQAIAQHMGISVRMVEKQISKALVICRSSLEGAAMSGSGDNLRDNAA